MENSPLVSGGTSHAGGPPTGGSPLPDHWRMARAAHVDLLLMGMPRVNLLLIAPDGVVRFVARIAAARSAGAHRAVADRPDAGAATGGRKRHAGAARSRHAPNRRSTPAARLAGARRGPHTGHQHLGDAAARARPRWQLHRHALLPPEHGLCRRHVTARLTFAASRRLSCASARSVRRLVPWRAPPIPRGRAGLRTSPASRSAGAPRQPLLRSPGRRLLHSPGKAW